MTNNASTPTTAGRIGRRLANALVALSVFAGTITAIATPAEAASEVSACFTYKGGSIADVPATLEVWLPGVGWYRTALSYPLIHIDPAGILPPSCTRMSLYGAGYDLRGYYVRIVVNTRHQGYTWIGTPVKHATPGDGAVHLGSTAVACIGCVW